MDLKLLWNIKFNEYWICNIIIKYVVHIIYILNILIANNRSGASSCLYYLLVAYLLLLYFFILEKN